MPLTSIENKSKPAPYQLELMCLGSFLQTFPHLLSPDQSPSVTVVHKCCCVLYVCIRLYQEGIGWGFISIYHLQGWNFGFGKGRLFSKLVLPSIRAISLDTQILPAVHPACANSNVEFSGEGRSGVTQFQTLSRSDLQGCCSKQSTGMDTESLRKCKAV